jgi:hypothetical protein
MPSEQRRSCAREMISPKAGISHPFCSEPESGRCHSSESARGRAAHVAFPMSRNRSQRCSSTEIPCLFRSFKLPQGPLENSQYRAANLYSGIRFASGAQSNEAATASTGSVFMQIGDVHLEFTQGTTIPDPVYGNTEDRGGTEIA